MIGTSVLIGIGAWPSVQRFLDRTPPRPAVNVFPEPPLRPPMADCALGPLDRSRPPFWSLGMELGVHRTVIEQRFLWLVSPQDGRPIGLPDAVLIDDRALRYPRWRPDASPADDWPMNDACSQITALRRSTAASFRRMNRDAAGQVFRWLTLPVPIILTRTPSTERERPEFMRIDPNRVGILRFSHVGFSADSTQALVAVGRYYAWGWSEGTYYLLERRGDVWRIVDESLIWQV